MVDIIQREVSATDLKGTVEKLIPDSIARDIEKACQGNVNCHLIFCLLPLSFGKASVLDLRLDHFNSRIRTINVPLNLLKLSLM